MTATSHDKVLPLRIADARQGIRHVFVRDLTLDAQIGVYDHEFGRRQKIRVNIDLAVADHTGQLPDQIDAVVCYDKVVTDIKAIVEAGHTGLVETLAERIAESGLADPRVISVRVRIEKLEAIPGTLSVGVEIERFRRDTAQK